MNDRGKSVAEQDAEATVRATTDIEKNSREMLRVGLVTYKGQNYVSARLWYDPLTGGDLRPGRHGWMLRIDKLPELIQALANVAAAASAEGLLQGTDHGRRS